MVIYLKGSGHRIPNLVLNKNLALFLSLLWGDGWIKRRSLIEEIDYILKKLGLNPRKYVWNRKNGNKLYGLYLKGKKQVKLFAQKINFIGKKNKLLNEYIKSIAPK